MGFKTSPAPSEPQILGGDVTLLCHLGHINGDVGETPLQGDRGTRVGEGGSVRPRIACQKAGAQGQGSSHCQRWADGRQSPTVTPETSTGALTYQTGQRRAPFLKLRYKVRARLTKQ